MPTAPGEWPDGMRAAQPGTLIAVEPMISPTTGQTRQKRHDWPVFTAEGSMAVHYEYDVLITEHGPDVLTDGLQNVPEVIG